MRYLFPRWDNIKKDITGKFVLLFLDYDGTLTPIVRGPDKALISKQARELLKKLSAHPRCMIAVVTGRVAKDIKGKIGIRNIIYASNHGLQIEGPNIRFEAPLTPDYKTILQKIKNELKQMLSPVKGILLEDKGLSLALHYRLTNKKEVPFIRETFHRVALPYLRLGKIKTEIGKKVFEVKPATEWEKGKAVLWLLSKQKPLLCAKPILPIYVGDDVTDEDAFRALKYKGLTVFVGRPKRSYAKYYLKNTGEVSEFLKRLCSILSPSSSAI